MTYVPPGSGWPGDPARPDTPVAHDPAEVAELAGASRTLAELTARQSVCRACPRLVEWREEVATVKRRAFAEETYWGRPIAGWGDERPEVLIVGLAPAAHGGNRTGRIFTGDRSGDWLFASLHRTGLAVRETSVHAGDGQRLIGARMVAAVRCAPPANRPEPSERATCLPWLSREVALVAGGVRVVVALGGFAWQAVWPALKDAGYDLPRPRPPFGHGAEVEISRDGAPAWLLGCYHPSQQNTFTGRVTAEMLDQVFARANALRSLGTRPQREC
ncbi:uracil-DNA glycosylase [Streptosporangium canum]|uniref:uracil-DNA glycosylase n=1 Tax=Streptosporangium canum TaxID=324952 RepID=UPI0036A8204A